MKPLKKTERRVLEAVANNQSNEGWINRRELAVAIGRDGVLSSNDLIALRYLLDMHYLEMREITEEHRTRYEYHVAAYYFLHKDKLFKEQPDG